MSDLAAEFRAVRNAREAATGQRWSNRRIAELAGVSGPTVDRLMKGTGKIEPANLDAIADVLNVPIEKAREWAGLPPVAGGPYTAPDVARLLSERQRAALDELIRSIVSGAGAVDEPKERNLKLGRGTASQDPGMGGDEQGDERYKLRGG